MTKRSKTLCENFSPSVVSDVVDQLEPETAPDNDRYCPQNQKELALAVGKMVKELPDDFVRPAYHEFSQIMNKFRKDNGQPGSESQMKTEQKKIEEGLRKIIRNMLIEMNVVEAGVDPKKMHNQGRKMDGPMLKDIGQEFGWGASHTKGMVTRAIHKAEWLRDYKDADPTGYEEMITDAVFDYIEEIKNLGQLPGEPGEDAITKDDIKLLADHPEMVLELDSFRTWLGKRFKEEGYNDPYSKASREG